MNKKLKLKSNAKL